MFNREPVDSWFSPLLFGLHSSETSHTLVFKCVGLVFDGHVIIAINSRDVVLSLSALEKA